MTSLIYSNGSLILYNGALATDTNLCDCTCGGECQDKCPAANVTIDGSSAIPYTGETSQLCDGNDISILYPDEVADLNGTIWYHLDNNNCAYEYKRIYFWCGASGTIYVLECPEVSSTDMTPHPCDSGDIVDNGDGTFTITIQGCDEDDLEITWSN